MKTNNILTPQQLLSEHTEAVEQIEKTIEAKQKQLKQVQGTIEKLKVQLETKKLEKELLLRSHNLCFDCNKSLSSDEVKFCIDRKLNPLCQACQRKQDSPEPLEPSKS